MGAQTVDTECNKYWLLLSPGEKQTLLSVAKLYVELKENVTSLIAEQCNRELDDAMTRINSGQFITHDQVKGQSQT